MLFNYRKALMKPYANVGLTSLEKEQAETLTSLMQAKIFRRAQEYLLQIFEALYHYFLSLYVAHMEWKKGKVASVTSQHWFQT